MSRAYTNREGEYVEVSKEHLDASVLIYEELAKQSPSRRVSWARHKKMMEDNGFEDSEASEQYRQMLKAERSSRGVLPSIEKHADMLSDGKVQLLKDELGNLYQAKRELQLHANSLNKTRRELAMDLIIVESVKEAMRDIDWKDIKLPDFSPVNDGDIEVLVTLNDLHYGYDVERYATIESTEKTLNDYADKVLEYAINKRASKITVANLGDTIENKLHHQGAVDSKKSAAQQMVEASKLIIKFINKLAEHMYVDYIVLQGNHDRINPNYKQSLDNEGFVDINIAMVEMFFEDFDNVKVLETDSVYHHTMDIKGVSLFMAHGDRHKGTDHNLLGTLSMNNNKAFDIFLSGHLHRISILEVGENKFQIITGSLKGNDSFSEKINKKAGKNQVGITFYNNTFEIDVIRFE